jgi:hypothetical protein
MLREEHKLRILENRVITRIFEARRNDQIREGKIGRASILLGGG